MFNVGSNLPAKCVSTQVRWETRWERAGAVVGLHRAQRQPTCFGAGRRSSSGFRREALRRFPVLAPHRFPRWALRCLPRLTLRRFRRLALRQSRNPTARRLGLAARVDIRLRFARALRVWSCHRQLQSDPLRYCVQRQPTCFGAGRRRSSGFGRLALRHRRSPTARRLGLAARVDTRLRSARALRVWSCHRQLQSDPLRCCAQRQPTKAAQR